MNGRVDEYVEARVQRLLAETGRVAEQGISATCRERILVLTGVVESPVRRDEILRLVAEEFPDLTVRSDIIIAKTHPPADAEDVP